MYGGLKRNVATFWNSYSVVILSCLLLLSTGLQKLNLVQLGSAGIKPIHIIVIAVFLFNFKQIRLRPQITPLALQLTFFGVWSIAIAATSYFDMMSLNLLFSAFTLIVLSSAFNWEFSHTLLGLRIAAAIILATTTITILLNFGEYQNAISAGLESGARPLAEGPFFSGGINIQASWIAIFGALFSRSIRWFAIYFIPALAVQLFYMSRAGLLALIIVAIFTLVYHRRSILIRLGKTVTAVVVISILVVSSFIISISGLWGRFLIIGAEPGSQGRLKLWSVALDSINDRPLIGWGAGNEVAVFRNHFSTNILEDNLHNSFLTALFTAGVLGLLVYLLTTFLELYRLSKWVEPFILLVSFCFVSLLEFRLAELPVLVPLALLVGALAGPARSSIQGKKSRVKNTTFSTHDKK